MKRREKTKELILYIADKMQDRPNYGATWLNKALYFIDATFFLYKNKSISGFTYIKQDFGPTPEPSFFLSLRNEMLKTGEIKEVKESFFGHIQKKYIPARKANINAFTKEEISHIGDILSELAEANASEISDFSHHLMAWRFAAPNEELPLFSYLLTHKPPSQENLEWANRLKKKYVRNHQGKEV